MVSPKALALRATQAVAPLDRLRATQIVAPLDQLRDDLAPRLGAMLRAVLARWSDGLPVVYGDADSSVLFAIRDEPARQDSLLRRAHR